jgi:hypothetical protein
MALKQIIVAYYFFVTVKSGNQTSASIFMTVAQTVVFAITGYFCIGDVEQMTMGPALQR